MGRAQAPEPAVGHRFNEFNIYQMAVYSRADLMYGMLRDMLGDSTFTAFLHDYYARWRFKHVDELAMRASAERVSGRDLGWFFEQWVHHTGLVDYALGGCANGARWRGMGDACQGGAPRRVPAWDAGWCAHGRRVDDRARGPAARRPVGGDSHGGEAAGCSRRSAALHGGLGPPERCEDVRASRSMVARRCSCRTGPFSRSADRDQQLVAVGPRFWYTGPGGLASAVRLRSSYAAVGDLAWDVRELGIGVSAQVPEGAPGIEHLAGWLSFANPQLPFVSRPLMGVSAGVWLLDGITKAEIAKAWI